MQSNTFLIILLLLMMQIGISKQIRLVRQNNDNKQLDYDIKYVLKINVGNIKMNLSPILSLQDKYNWIKSNQCKYCTMINNNNELNQQTKQQNKQKKGQQQKEQTKLQLKQKKEQQKQKNKGLQNKGQQRQKNKRQSKQHNNNAIQIYDNKQYDCSQSCFNHQQQQYGLKCISTHNNNCQVKQQNIIIKYNNTNKNRYQDKNKQNNDNSNKDQHNNNNKDEDNNNNKDQSDIILKGKLIKINMITQYNKQHFNQFQTILVDRIYSNSIISTHIQSQNIDQKNNQQPQIQQNKLNNQHNKQNNNNNKNNQNYNQNQYKENQNKDNKDKKLSKNNKDQQLSSMTIKQINNNPLLQLSILQLTGQYNIWGKYTIFNHNIITANTIHQIIIYNSISQPNLQKLLLNTTPIQIQFQQSITLFTLSQLKLNQIINLNHQQKIIQDHQFPILPTQHGFFNLQTQHLLLPKKYHSKLIQYIISTYLQYQNTNKCSYKLNKQNKQTIIQCQKQINLQPIQYVQLQLIINGISIGFPINSLLTNCKSNTCNIMISQSPNNSFSIGTFILSIFAIQYIPQTQNIILHRLNNQYNQLYSNNLKYHKQKFNIFYWITASLFHTILWIIKIIFYLALFSLIINLIYHWKQIISWITKIFNKIKKNKLYKQQSNQLFQNQQDLQSKDTAKLIKRFKNKKNKVFIQDHNQIINQQITTQQSN